MPDFLEAALDVSGLRHAVRSLRRSPGFTAVAIISLSLGIGANTAIFTVVDQVLLRPLPVKEPESLVMLTDSDERGSGTRYCYRIYAEVAARNAVFSGLLARSAWDHDLPIYVSIGGGRVEKATIELNSGNFFDVLGVHAHIGRLFSPEDDRPPGNPVAVISYRYWQQRFGADTQVIGKTILVRGFPFTITGVTPPEFFGIEVGSVPAIRIPLTTATTIWPQPKDSKANENYMDDPSLGMNHTNWLQLVGRLKPGVSRQQAEAALQPLNRQIRVEEAQSPNWERTSMNRAGREQFLRRGIAVSPAARGFSWLRSSFLEPLLALMALVGVLLLIACSTLANLLLARGAGRQRELAVRLAMGAGRLRLSRQMLMESLLLACAGGALGVLVAWWGASALIAAVPEGAPVLRTAPDARVLAFTFSLALLTGVLFGLAPVVQALRTEVMDTLKAQGAALAGHASHFRVRKILIVIQVALSALLLVAAGLFVRTLGSLKNQNTGLNAARVIQMYVQPFPYSGSGMAEFQAIRQDYYQRLLERLQSLPGVHSVAGSATLLLANDWNNWPVTVPGRDAERVSTGVVTSGFFKTLGIPLVAGRIWSPQDDFSPVRMAVVSESFARGKFGGNSPVGHSISTYTDVPYSIVGVVRDVDHPNNLREHNPRAVYLSPGGLRRGPLVVYLRTSGDPGTLIAAARREAESLSREAQVSYTGTLEDQVDKLLSNERLVAQLSSILGLLATLLAAIGLYGVIAFSVARRTREIGLRMALGAKRAQIHALILCEVLKLMGAGVAMGLLAGLGVARLARSMLFGVAPGDPATLAGVALLVGSTALLAGYLPARRAARIDPIAALRCE